MGLHRVVNRVVQMSCRICVGAVCSAVQPAVTAESDFVFEQTDLLQPIITAAELLKHTHLGLSPSSLMHVPDR